MLQAAQGPALAIEEVPCPFQRISESDHSPGSTCRRNGIPMTRPSAGTASWVRAVRVDGRWGCCVTGMSGGVTSPPGRAAASGPGGGLVLDVGEDVRELGRRQLLRSSFGRRGVEARISMLG
jgi:hypothetical protein